jgi:hypothetical protein
MSLPTANVAVEDNDDIKEGPLWTTALEADEIDYKQDEPSRLKQMRSTISRMRRKDQCGFR